MLLQLTNVSTDSDYDQIYTKPPGTVIKIAGEYEYILNRLNERVPVGKNFQWSDILPGTSHYSLYGPSHVIITVNV